MPVVVLTALGGGELFFLRDALPGAVRAMRDRWPRGTGLVVLAVVSLLAISTQTVLEPVAAESTSTLNLTLRTRCGEVMTDDLVVVRATLTSNGVGIAGARLSVVVQAGALSAPQDTGGGEYVFNWTAPFVVRPTYFPMWVRAHADGYDNATARIVFLVDPHRTNTLSPTQLFLYVRPSSTTVRAGGTVDVAFFAYTIEGYLVADVTVYLTRVGPGTLSPARVAGCGYAFGFTAPAAITSPTSVLISITVNKVGYAQATARLGLTITP